VLNPTKNHSPLRQPEKSPNTGDFFKHISPLVLIKWTRERFKDIMNRIIILERSLKKMNRHLYTYVLLFIGAVVQGTSMAIFLFPHSIPSGGAAGLAILMNHWLHLPLGLALWVANFSFLVLALKYFGYSWTIRTMYSVTITSITVNLITEYVSFPHVNLWLDLLCGSILFGIGVGILIRHGASSGGMVIPALMIATYKGWSPGKVMLGLNLFIFILTASVIDYKIVFYAILCQTISTNIIDIIYYLKWPSFPFISLGWRKK
jgi:uncharacterized membrane-anchored protein YitT (DUF2179 family)